MNFEDIFDNYDNFDDIDYEEVFLSIFDVYQFTINFKKWCYFITMMKLYDELLGKNGEKTDYDREEEKMVYATKVKIETESLPEFYAFEELLFEINQYVKKDDESESDGKFIISHKDFNKFQKSFINCLYTKILFSLSKKNDIKLYFDEKSMNFFWKS